MNSVHFGFDAAYVRRQLNILGGHIVGRANQIGRLLFLLSPGPLCLIEVHEKLVLFSLQNLRTMVGADVTVAFLL